MSEHRAREEGPRGQRMWDAGRLAGGELWFGRSRVPWGGAWSGKGRPLSTVLTEPGAPSQGPACVLTSAPPRCVSRSLDLGDWGELPLQVLGRETHDGGRGDASAEPGRKGRAA